MKRRSALTDRPTVLLVGCLALLLLATTGSQCAKVTDPAKQGLTPEMTPEFAACVQACNQVAQEARAAELDLHIANIEACAGDPDCLAAEEERHEAVMEQIVLDMQGCKDGCQHEQGGGSGGE